MLTCRVPRFAALLLAATLAGCTGSTSTPSPTPSVVASTTSPTPTLSEGQKAANDTVVKYRALIDELRSQAMPDISRLLSVSRGDAYDQWGYTIQDDFRNGEHQTGTSSVSITATEPGQNARQWVVSACVDFTKVDIVDKNGKSVLRSPAIKEQVTYTVDQDTTSPSWFVTREVLGSAC